MDAQVEFLFADGPTPELAPPDPRAGLFAEIAALWQIPLGEKVHVALRTHQFADLYGRLELARAPDLPLNGRETLKLRIGHDRVYQPADHRVGAGLGLGPP